MDRECEKGLGFSRPRLKDSWLGPNSLTFTIVIQ